MTLKVLFAGVTSQVLGGVGRRSDVIATVPALKSWFVKEVLLIVDGANLFSMYYAKTGATLIPTDATNRTPTQCVTNDAMTDLGFMTVEPAATTLQVIARNTALSAGDRIVGYIHSAGGITVKSSIVISGDEF